jgi:thiaminase
MSDYPALANHRLNESATNHDVAAQDLSHDGQPNAGLNDDIPEDDLVNRLIRDNSDLWNQLLHNDFVEQMRFASADNTAVLNGFKWYMIQDFFYCVQLIAYNADRAAKAPNPTIYGKLTRTLNDTLTQWAPNALQSCTDPDKLNIPDTVVFAAKREEATERYTKFISDIAEDENWVVSLLAQVAGIQSYYAIASDLKQNSAYQDTAWYRLWAVENAKHYRSTVEQINFFKNNYESWKDTPYEKLTRIFRKACQSEIDLWNVALNPGPVA